MLLQFPSIAALSILSFSSHALALSSGHARLHRHPAQAQRLEGRMVPRSDAPTIEVPVNLFHLLRAESAAFQEWMGVWLDSESTADSPSSVALLRQEIQAYEGWMTAWLNAATSTDAPTSIPPPPSIPVTFPTVPATSSQVLSTSHVNPSSRSSRLNLPKVSSSAPTFPSATTLPLAGEFFQLHQSVTQPKSRPSNPIKPPQTSFLTVTSQKVSGASSSILSSAPFSAPPAQTPKPRTVTPVPVISSAPTETPATTPGITDSPSSGSDGSKGFNAMSDRNLAVYYGQSPATAKMSLKDLCQNENVDIVVLAFLTEFFAGGGFPKLNFGSACGGQTPEMKEAGASGLLHCPDMASHISVCQSLGKKVLLSLGGSIAVSAFASDSQASEFATTLWDLFGAGTGVDPGLRPFGSVKIDGFDVDNEDHSTSSYSAFVSSLRSTMNADQSKTYYISAAPQCPRPDASIPLDAMQAMDFIFIQFYNNEAANCNVGQPGFIDSLKAWSSDLAAKGAGPRLYVGAPGCPDCAGSGYLDASSIASVMADVKNAGIENLGGTMLWDGSEAKFNVDGGSDFLTVMKNSLP